MYSLEDQLTMKILTNIMTELPLLEADMELQLKVRNKIESSVYQYSIQPTSTELVVSDLEDKIAYFIQCKAIKGLSQATLKEYMYLLTKLRDFVVKPVAMITTYDLRCFIGEISKNNTGSTINNKIITLNNFFEFLQKEEIISRNPMNKIEKVKEQIRKRKPLTIEEQEIIRASNLTARQQAMFELFVSSGIRVGEIIKIKISNIDWENRSFYVIGKGNKERRCRFSTRCKIALLKYIEERKDLPDLSKSFDYLFIGMRKPYKNIGVRTFQKELIEIMETSGGLNVYLIPHKCRHTFASNNNDNGMSLTTLSHLMGHSSTDTTQGYITQSDQKVDMEYNKSIK